MVSYGKYVWGDRHESYGTRGDLRKANVLAQPNDECQSTFSKGNLNDSRVACVAGLGFAYFVLHTISKNVCPVHVYYLMF